MNFVYADCARNLLHLIYVGTLSKAEATELHDAVKAASVQLRPGFAILADLRDLKVVHQDAFNIIADQMEFLDARGAGKVVRVLPAETENFGFVIMSIFHYDHDVRFVTCLNLEDAVAALSGRSGFSKNDAHDGVRRAADSSSASTE